jgi:hypothetical protein
MKSYIIKVSGRKVDEVVFLNNKNLKDVKAAMIKEGYDPKTLSVKESSM